MTDLSRKDFTVYEDGKRQEIALFAASSSRSSGAVLDTSTAPRTGFGSSKTVRSALPPDQPGDRLMVMSFDNESAS